MNTKDMTNAYNILMESTVMSSVAKMSLYDPLCEGVLELCPAAVGALHHGGYAGYSKLVLAAALFLLPEKLFR